MAKNIRTTEVQALVSIAGEQVNFIRLSLSQEMGQHHDFEVLIDYRTFDAAFHESPDAFMQKTNKRVAIDLQHADQPEKAYMFVGVVTSVKMIAIDGMHGAVSFTGQSLTVELERGEMMQTYSSTNLKEIFGTITDGTLNLSTENDPAWKADIDFALQYRESDWRFLQRLCRQYFERFYYSGMELVIGPHREFPKVDLTYDMELRSFEFCSRLVPNQFSTYYYKREENKKWEQDDPGSIENATSLLETISGRSDTLTAMRKPNTPSTAYVPDMGSLKEHAKRRKVSDGARMMYVRGVCKTCDVRIGRLVQIKMPENMGGTDMGTYRVYKTFHEFDQNGRYRCEFEALPSDLEYLPTPEVPIPTPNPIEVKVWDNEDPKGLGRVRVEFPFDERTCETWIPLMSLDAGGKGKGLGPVNRGFVFIPEKGDSVLVDFLDGQPLSHPVVIGSMYHGENAENQGGGKGNHIKTIMTRSNHRIEFNDEITGGWGITIKDDCGNVIHMSTKGKNIEITAPETISLSAKNIHMTALENVKISAGEDLIESAGKNKTDTAGETHIISAKNKKTFVDENLYTQVKRDVTIDVLKDTTVNTDDDMKICAGKAVVDVTKEDTFFKSTGKITLKSGDIIDVAQGK